MIVCAVFTKSQKLTQVSMRVCMSKTIIVQCLPTNLAFECIFPVADTLAYVRGQTGAFTCISV